MEEEEGEEEGERKAMETSVVAPSRWSYSFLLSYTREEVSMEA
jgi:hypothetical protein